MNYLDDKFDSVEAGITKLKEGVKMRDSMGGAMYYNAVNDDCCEIARKLSKMGVDQIELSEILGKGTHT